MHMRMHARVHVHISMIIHMRVRIRMQPAATPKCLPSHLVINSGNECVIDNANGKEMVRKWWGNGKEMMRKSMPKKPKIAICKRANEKFPKSRCLRVTLWIQWLYHQIFSTLYHCYSSAPSQKYRCYIHVKPLLDRIRVHDIILISFFVNTIVLYIDRFVRVYRILTSNLISLLYQPCCCWPVSRLVSWCIIWYHWICHAIYQTIYM